MPRTQPTPAPTVVIERADGHLGILADKSLSIINAQHHTAMSLLQELLVSKSQHDMDLVERSIGIIYNHCFTAHHAIGALADLQPESQWPNVYANINIYCPNIDIALQYLDHGNAQETYNKLKSLTSTLSRAEKFKPIGGWLS